jgi:type IV secretory pathway VirB3-like protein
MTSEPITHMVYTSINRPLTIAGVDRRLFLLALLMGAATFNMFGTLLGGVCMFAALYLVARIWLSRDPQWLRIVLNASRARAVYDAAKLDLITVRRMTSHATKSTDRS